MNKDKILILGAKGMLGRELAEVFSSQNPILWDKEEIDISSNKEVQEKIGKLKPRIIINAAAYTNVDEAEKNKDLSFKINGEAVGFLAEISKKIDAILIHYSTDYVFDGNKKDGYKENDEPKNPLNIYGQSKLLGEQLLKKNTKKYYLIRTSWLFGKYGKNFVETILNLSQKQKELEVVDDQYGKPTYAPDLAKKTKEILEKQKPFGIYHVTNEKMTNWYEFARKILEVSNINKKVKPCKSEKFSRPAKRPSYSILLNNKLGHLRNWEEALKDYIYERNNFSRR